MTDNFRGIVPPDTNRMVVRKYAASTLKTFVPVLAVRLTEAVCEGGLQYEMQFLRPRDQLERHEEVSILARPLCRGNVKPLGEVLCVRALRSGVDDKQKA